MNGLKFSLRKQKAVAIATLLTLLPLLGGLSGCNNRTENGTTPGNQTEDISENLPTQRFTDVPGWLALGTKPEKEGVGEYPFSPVNPDAEIAIFSEQWSLVQSDTPLVAVAPGVKEEVTFRRSQKEPYGCDDVPTQMATFTATKPLPEGAIWLLPPSQRDAATAVAIEPLELNEIPETVLPLDKRVPLQVRAWKAGDTVMVLEKIGEKQARLTVADKGEEIYNTEVEILSIEGSYEEAIDFSRPYQPGLPQPIGAFEFSDRELPLVVLWTSSFEGHSFQVLSPTDGKLEAIDLGSVYYCAF